MLLIVVGGEEAGGLKVHPFGSVSCDLPQMLLKDEFWGYSNDHRSKLAQKLEK
jgi:hypothetical protein